MQADRAAGRPTRRPETEHHRRQARCRPAAGRAGAALASISRDNSQVIEVEPARFEEMVVEALDGLPPKLGQMMENVAVTVQHEPGPPGLLGLYQGIPLTNRSTHYAGVLPDRITIYHQAICAICRTQAEVVEQVRRTVIHEVGHYFGLDDERLHELGW
jgi:predicted Zn-dependent protease with MMP-like domain